MKSKFTWCASSNASEPATVRLRLPLCTWLGGCCGHFPFFHPQPMRPKYYNIPPPITHRHPASPFLVREPAAELTSAQRQCQPRPLGSGNALMLSSSFCSCVVAIRHFHRIQTPHFQITSRLGLGPGPKILTCPHSTKPWHPGENRSRCCCINGAVRWKRMVLQVFWTSPSPTAAMLQW